MIDRTKELRTIARRASGHAGMLKNIQQLTGGTDEEMQQELTRRLERDLEDYTPGKS